MNILITGNMGYIGPNLVKHLRRTYPDASLTGLDLAFFAHCLTNAVRLPESMVDVQYFGDVRKVDVDFLKGFDAVVHLAAISNDPMGKTFEDATYEINHLASVDIARKARDAGVSSFVYASSCSIYGAAEDSPRTEESNLNPLTAYAKSKVRAERDLEQLARDGFKITCLRFATACGMSDRLRLDLVLNDFVAAAVVSKKITILSDGTPWRPLINTKDMARAIDWAITRDAAEAGSFLAVNAGSDEWNYQIKDLAEAVARVVGGVEVSINTNAEPDRRSYRVDFSLFRKLAPSHQPQYDLTATVEELKEGLEAMRFRDTDFRNSTYMRLKVLTSLRESGLLTERLQWIEKSTIGSLS